MKRIALLLAFAAVATPALAADVIYDEPPAPAPVEFAPSYNWSGLYVGGQAGVAFGGAKGASGIAGGFPDDAITFREKGGAGFVGGGNVGYDKQIGNVIVGGVADFNYVDHDRGAGVVLQDNSADGSTYRSKADIDYYGTVRGKIGVAYDRVAVYGTGGLAYGKVKDGVNGSDTFTSASGTGYSVSADGDKDKLGYSVGAGVDVLATENVSFGLEYLYTDLGSAKSKTDFDAVGTPQAGDPANFSAETKNDLDFHTVMAKAAYRFN